jgi:hypothetical protein
MDENEKGIQEALRQRLASVSDLFGANEVAQLAAAWGAGPSRAFLHPLVEVLLGDGFRKHARVLASGLRLLREQDVDLRTHVRRMTLPAATSDAFIEALGAINELHVAASLAKAGATIRFVATGKQKTPDISAAFGSATATFEVTAWGLPQRQVASGNRMNHAFRHWKRGGPVPRDLKGVAHDYGNGSRMMEQGVSLLEGSTLAEKVRALIGKKASSQLQDRPNPVLVISARHQWGVSASDCLPRTDFRHGIHSGLCYAAAYGRHDDYLFEGQEFEGSGQKVGIQLGDGILRRSASIAAVLFLFNRGPDVVLENLQSSAGFSSQTIRLHIGKAFTLDAKASILKAR